MREEWRRPIGRGLVLDGVGVFVGVGVGNITRNDKDGSTVLFEDINWYVILLTDCHVYMHKHIRFLILYV